MANECVNLAAVVHDALRERRRMYDAFHADAELFEPDGAEHVDINYKGKGYRIEVNGPFEIE